MVKLTFVFVGDGKTTSQGEKLLQRTAALSHAARIGHARLKARRQAIKGEEMSDRPREQQPTNTQLKFAVAASRKGSNVRHLPKDRKRYLRRKEYEEDEEGDVYLRNMGILMNHVERYFAHPIDPFSDIPHSRSPAIVGTLYFFTKFVAPSYNVMCDLFNLHDIYRDFIEWMQNERFLTAAVAAVHRNFELMRYPGSKPSVDTLKYKGKAISQVRTRLEGMDEEVDSISMMSIMFLAMVEKSTGDLWQYVLHRKNIARILAKQGGLDAFKPGRFERTFMLHFDSFWALPNSPTLFPGARRPYKPEYPLWPYDTDTLDLLYKIPAGFMRLVEEEKLSYDILEVIARLADRGVKIGPLPERQRYRYKYIDIWEAVPALSALGDPDALFERLLCLTLMVYRCINFGDTRAAVNFFERARAELSLGIKQFIPTTRAEEDCLLWMWVVTIDTWRVARKLLPPGAQLRQDLDQRFPETRDWRKLEERLIYFFWTDEISKPAASYWSVAISPGSSPNESAS